MSSWSMASLSDLGKISRGKSKHRPRNDASLYGGDYPFIQTGDVKEANFYINEYSQTYNENGLKQSKLWAKDTLCITIAANIAESALLKFPACFPDSIVGFIPYEGVSDVRYIKYLLDNYKTEFQKRSKGATQDNLSVDKINSLKVKVPNYSYQVKVADIISTYDYLIENNQNRISTLEEMAQRLYTEWFIKFKFSGHQKVKMVDSGTALGMIPVGWAVNKLSEFASLTMGQSPKSEFYNENGEGLPFHQGVSNFGYLYPENKVYSSNGNRLAKNGDLLFSVRAPVGKLNIAASELILGRGLAAIRHKQNRQSFLLSMFFNRFTEKDMLGNGSIYKSINKSELENLLFIIPPEELIELFEPISEKYFEKLNILTQRTTNLSMTRDLLIENLVTGKKRLKS